MDIKQIKQIIDLIKRSELTEFAIEEKDFKLKICREGTGAGTSFTLPSQVLAAPGAALPLAEAAAPVAASAAAATAAPAAPEVEENVTYIKSPMVGTFYHASSPDSAPFVQDGSKVTETTIVCIIEAMKIMNEIQAETKGTIIETLVENGQPVEYGQQLFKVKQG
ncbi:acetyl-CoA carboxylase biotin carboxyl carrier protein subunit [Cephaloticoccus primus]|uniref:Biotin carboxyl carrier protein of acetyl-CoA carboxylase n=1 Tax=Cephaloticoccus primus TaxID=1548207 RepID=A0A139SJ57_9BACT|nr:acetyl-CoA carboxylase biotin carboxyl carrier protein [Cephaloticoccus primus]KXU34510.1 acetyl-CoA carboxylase biotin carboxyl carrier protein subunit [Cephaloticoccus primus]